MTSIEFMDVQSSGATRGTRWPRIVAGEPLDRAMLTGILPPEEYVIACAREGVETFLARYGTAGRSRK
jgi:hypothetical protein